MQIVGLQQWSNSTYSCPMTIETTEYLSILS